MENTIQEFMKGKAFNEQTFQELEDFLGVGIFAKTKASAKTIHETKKKIFVQLNVVNKNEFTVCKWTELQTLRQPPSQFLFTMHNSTKARVLEKDGSITKISVDEMTPYMLQIKVDDDVNLKAEMDKRMEDLEEVCALFDVNPSELCYKETMICQRLAYLHVNCLKGAEHISDKETELLDASTRGQLQYVEKGANVKGCRKFDVNSLYTFLMTATEFKFPMTSPTLTPVPEDKKDLASCFLVKLKIEGEHKYFTNTPGNYYNNYQVKLLDLLEIPYSFASKQYWVYEDPVPAKHVFAYMKGIYALRALGNMQAKPVLNCTWGALSKKKSFAVPLGLLNPEQIDKVIDFDLEKGIAQLQDTGRKYRHKMGRIKAWLMAHARWRMVVLLLKIENAGHTIYQVNTDGFITDATVKQMKEFRDVSSEIGSLKVEKEYTERTILKNVNAVEILEGEDDEDCDVLDEE